MNRLLALIIIVFIGGCLGAKNTTCKHYFESCNKKAERPPCENLVLYDSTNNHIVPLIKDLVGKVDSSEVKNFIGNEYSNFYFSEESKRADSFWYYDNSGKMDGEMMVETEGIIALKVAVFYPNLE